jgi:hypothetical protein
MSLPVYDRQCRIRCPRYSGTSCRNKALDARVAALEKISEARFSEINTKLDARFSEIGTKLDTLLSLHDLQVRITELESQRTA